MSQKSLTQMWDEVPDPRSRRGRRHPLPAVLNLTVLAILAGMKSLEAIAQFGREHGGELAITLGFKRARFPTKSALSKIFRRLDVAAFEAVLARFVLARQSDGWTSVAIDGKTLRGSKDGDVPGVHLLAAFVPAAAAVIGQIKVDGKTNEHKAALQLLGMIPLEDKVVSADAMFCHKDVAQEILDGGGDYLLSVKENQPTLKADIISALHEEQGFSPLPTRPQASGRAASPFGR